MRPEGAGAGESCPVDHTTREKWLEAARAKEQANKKSVQLNPKSTLAPPSRFSLDNLSWEPVKITASRSSPRSHSQTVRLSTDREISTIPRSLNNDPTRPPNAAEKAAMRPSNHEIDTGHDKESGNWIYPSQEMFFNAMKRKGHDAQAADMNSVVPIHNAVNERAWAEIKKWEAGRGSEKCGGPKLVSFAGDSKALTPKARWNALLGYQTPFDRHDWIVDRCGQHVDYVIDFYSGKDDGSPGKSLSFYLDVRPKLNSFEGVKMRLQKTLGL